MVRWVLVRSSRSKSRVCAYCRDNGLRFRGRTMSRRCKQSRLQAAWCCSQKVHLVVHLYWLYHCYPPCDEASQYRCEQDVVGSEVSKSSDQWQQTYILEDKQVIAFEKNSPIVETDHLIRFRLFIKFMCVKLTWAHVFTSQICMLIGVVTGHHVQ